MDCAQCRASCCVSYVVGLEPADVQRLSDAGFEGFAVPAFDAPSGVDAEVVNQHLANMSFTKVLKKAEGGACVFLRWTAEGSGVCTVYDVRPDICARFGDPAADSSGRCGQVFKPTRSSLAVLPGG